jgi:hypothetical protein
MLELMQTHIKVVAGVQVFSQDCDVSSAKHGALLKSN